MARVSLIAWRWLGWLLIGSSLIGCESPAGVSAGNAKLATKTADRPPWYVRYEVAVVDEGQPVAGARVASLVEGRLLGRTDAEGRFVAWAPHDDTFVATRGEGAGIRSGWALVGFEPAPHVITLRAPHRVSGRVSQQGEPVAGALVTLGSHPAYSILSPRDEAVAPRPEPIPPDVPRWRRRCTAPVPDLRILEPGGMVRTDADGRFTFHAHVDEASSLEACAPGLVAPAFWEAVSTDLTTEEPVHLELLSRRRLHGRVVDEGGEPVEGARVRAVLSNMLGERVEEELITGSDGGFTHDAHPDHAVHFAVSRNGARTTVYVPPGVEQVTISLPPPG